MSREIASLLRTQNKFPPREHVVSLAGGLNLLDAVQKVNDGECIQFENYEVNIQGDYQSVSGFERYDGQPSPSDAEPDSGLETPEEELASLLANRETRRAAIEAIPGSGPCRGVFFFDDTLYAFRDNADATAKFLYKATEDGWELITTPALNPGGKLSWRILNFAGRAGHTGSGSGGSGSASPATGKEVVGVDGANKAFIFANDTLTLIDNVGMDPDDKPIALEVLPSEHLLLAYRGGSLQYSALGDPTDWDVANGAGEIALADEIKDIQLQANNSCAIFCRTRIYVLYGTTAADFNMTNFNTTTGALPHTVQTIGDSMFISDRGLTSLSRVQNFGNFELTTVSEKVNSLIQRYKKRIKASTIIKEKNQYRLFFDDGSGIIVTFFADKPPEFSTFNFGSDATAFVACTAESSGGTEVVFVGGENGYVYQLERGTSFDGEPIETYLRTSFSSFGPELYGIRKRLTRATIEVKTVSTLQMFIQADFDYSEYGGPTTQTLLITGSGAYWNQGIFDESFWSSAVVSRVETYTRGVGENVSVFCRTASLTATPHILTAVIYRFIPLALRR